MGSGRPQSNDALRQAATRRKRVVSGPVNILNFFFTVASVPDLFCCRIGLWRLQGATASRWNRGAGGADSAAFSGARRSDSGGNPGFEWKSRGSRFATAGNMHRHCRFSAKSYSGAWLDPLASAFWAGGAQLGGPTLTEPRPLYACPGAAPAQSRNAERSDCRQAVTPVPTPCLPLFPAGYGITHAPRNTVITYRPGFVTGLPNVGALLSL
jgi:hypothetical protein